MTREELNHIKDAFSQIIEDIAGNPDWYEAARAVASDLGTLERELGKKVVSLPSNLGEAANNYGIDIRLGYPRVMDETDKYIYNAFKAGAEWMAGQEIKIGETKIYLEDDGDEPPYSQEWLDLESTEFKLPDGAFQPGDEVEVILRKKQ